MRQLQWIAVAAMAALLVAGGAASALSLNDEVEGKVVAYEAGKSIEIEVGADNKKTLKIDEHSKIEGEVAVGKAVKAEVKDGVVLKLEVKK